MDFRILGPLEVSDGDRQVALGGARQRALLGMLLLHANEVVSSDRLIDELWPGEGLAEGSKALQVAVSRLRKALGGGDLIVTRPPGYELQVEPERLDLRRFEARLADGRRLLAEGEAEGAAKELAGALQLWRGEPLADLAYESFCQSEISRLDELRIAALEDRLAADLERGQDAELIGELRDLVARQPLRERLRAQLIRALYRAGRQAEALEAYGEARAALVEELGIEPGRELQELHAAVLRQDAALESRPDTAQAPEPSRGTFVGRERERATLTEALDGVARGRGRLVLLVGEPGIGKSRLAEEVMADARARDANVIVGRCWEAGGAPAYWPWVQALRAYARDAEPDALRDQLGAGAGDLAQLLPELHELFADLPEPPPQDSEGARFRLFEAAAAFLNAAAESRPLVLVLDDLHAADEPSLLLLRFLAREIGASPLLVVCALRDVDPTLSQPLTVTLAELAREPHTERIGLGGLGEEEVGEYIQLATGMRSQLGLVRAIREETEGNPLFVAEVVQLLDADGQIGEHDAHLRIPPGVRAVIGQRVGRLSEPCREVLVSASVLGREFGLDSLAELTGLPRDRLLGLLDEAVGERVVGDVPGVAGRLRFGHALIRDTLYDDLPMAKRLQLHERAAAALEAVYATDLDPHLAELAHHYAEASVAPKAAEYARRAGDRAVSLLAYEEAVRQYETALALEQDAGSRCDLLLALGDAQARAGDTPASKQAFRSGAALAEDLGLAAELGRAALGYGGRLSWEVSRDDQYLVPLLERALDGQGHEESELRVRLLARLAGGPLRDARFEPERRRALSAEALEIARRIGDPGTLAYALVGYISAHHHPDHTREQIVLATELIDVALEAGDLERGVEGYEHRAQARMELGDPEGARADVRGMAALAAELRQPSQDWFVAEIRAHHALLEGRFAEAEDLIAEALRLGQRSQGWSATVSHGLQLFVLRKEQGRLDEIEDQVRRSAARYATYPIWRCVHAVMTAELGHQAEARAEIEKLAEDGFAALPVNEMWLASMALVSDATGSLGDAGVAEAIYPLLLPYADRVAVATPEVSTGAIAYYLGLLATTMERWDDAERHFEQGLEVNERIGARPYVAHTRDHFARMLLARDGPGDRERAEQLSSVTDPAGETAPSRR